jgi:hypothetical protein
MPMTVLEESGQGQKLLELVCAQLSAAWSLAV